MNDFSLKTLLVALGNVLVFSQLAGCAKPSPSNVDPFERINRPIYGFNKVADKIILKPIAKVYQGLVPNVLQDRVHFFFQNLNEVPTLANYMLQKDFQAAGKSTARFLLNSTWGLGGTLDIASSGKKGISVPPQDFGMTLAKWGYQKTAYVVLPLFGPSTVRDTIGLGGNYYMDLPTYLPSVRTRNTLFGLKLLDKRTSLLKLESTLETSIDEYIFTRDAYLQNRQYRIIGYSNTAQSSEAVLTEPPE